MFEPGVLHEMNRKGKTNLSNIIILSGVYVWCCILKFKMLDLFYVFSYYLDEFHRFNIKDKRISSDEKYHHR